MFVCIGRRKLLVGAGVGLSWPCSDSMSRAMPATDWLKLAKPPLRMAFLFMPNGVRPEHWTPPGDGEDYELTPHLQPLAAYKNDFLLLENLWHKNSLGRSGHWSKVPVWLSGGWGERSDGKDLNA